MQSLSSIIKNTNVKTEGKIAIATDHPSILENADSASEVKEVIEVINEEEILKKKAESYEAMAKRVIENARKQSEAILSKAYEEAKNIEEQAFAQGYEIGKEQGYKDAYEETIGKSTKEANKMIQNANNILKSAKIEYEKYLSGKQAEILQLAVNMAEAVLKKKLIEVNGLEDMIFETLSNSRNSETYIIRVASKHVAELKEKVAAWKERLGLKGEVFIIGDEEITSGNAVIEKNSGKVVIGIDIGMESIRRALE